MVREQWRTTEIVGYMRIMSVDCLLANTSPFIGRMVVAAQPHQGDQVDLCVERKLGNQRLQFFKNRVVGMILQDRCGPVVGRIGGRGWVR